MNHMRSAALASGVGGLLVLILFSLFPACAPKAQQDHLSFKIDFGDPTFAREAIKNSKATCGDTNCPSAAVFVAAVDGNNAVFCSGALISDDLVVTNAHCIPSRFRSAGSNCSDFLWGIFPESLSAPEERMNCKTIETVSFDGSYTMASDREDKVLNRLDYAVVRMERPEKPAKRTPLTLARLGLSDAESVTLAVFDPKPFGKGVEGVFHSKQCNVDYRYSGASSADNGFVYLDGCAVIQGNSGGVVLSSLYDNSIRGLVFAAFTEKEENSPAKESAFAINAACIAYSLEGPFSTPKDCDQPLDLATQKISKAQSLRAE